MSDYRSNDVDTFVPWLRSFEGVTAAHRGRFGLDEATLSRIVIALATVEDAGERRSRAELAAQDAVGAVSQAQHKVATLEARHAEARHSLAAATAVREQAFAEAVSRVRPIFERLQDRSESSRDRERLRRSLVGTVAEPLAPSPPAPSPLRPSPLPPSPVVAAPADLVAVPLEGRVNILQWTITGGEPAAQYLIEASVGKLYRGSPMPPEIDGYRQITAVMGPSTTYRHTLERVPAGVQVRYRARAKRGSDLSVYSNEVVVTCR